VCVGILCLTAYMRKAEILEQRTSPGKAGTVVHTVATDYGTGVSRSKTVLLAMFEGQVRS
jgi:hypothetical protein